VCLYRSKNIGDDTIRRPELEINKIFSSNAKSYGSTRYNLARSSLHDRSTFGGNSEVWGGFFDTAHIKRLDKLKADGIKLIPLSFNSTGSHSNISSLVQLQEPDGEILNAAHHLRAGSNKYLHSLDFESGHILLKCVSPEDPDGSEFLADGRVFVCTGVVQTIDMLMRSNLIKPGDSLTLDEFEYELHISAMPKNLDSREASVISYAPGRALAHLFGIQKANFLSSFTPFVVNQIFHAYKRSLRMEAGINVLSGAPDLTGNEKSVHFGKSIHYCNLRINGERLQDMAARLSTKLHFVGMASVSQAKPGPISNDIFSYLEKITNEF